jgi:hypothetical protein
MAQYSVNEDPVNTTYVSSAEPTSPAAQGAAGFIDPDRNEDPSPTVYPTSAARVSNGAPMNAKSKMTGVTNLTAYINKFVETTPNFNNFTVHGMIERPYRIAYARRVDSGMEEPQISMMEDVIAAKKESDAYKAIYESNKEKIDAHYADAKNNVMAKRKAMENAAKRKANANAAKIEAIENAEEERTRNNVEKELATYKKAQNNERANEFRKEQKVQQGFFGRMGSLFSRKKPITTRGGKHTKHTKHNKRHSRKTKKRRHH